MMSDPPRIAKLMAERGLCSRREADDYIACGLVYVDGQRVTELGTRAAPTADIRLAPQARRQQAQQRTVPVHKPVGYVSGQAEDGHPPAALRIDPKHQRAGDQPRLSTMRLTRLAPADRLDIDSTGLLVLTQNGRIARARESTIEKKYLVRIDGTLSKAGLKLLDHGLALDGRPLKPARVSWLDEGRLRFVLREGRKRQIRRMCELVGVRVVGLKRVRIGRVRLGDLPLGQWRFLRSDERF